jgi:hypothetical protein
MTKRKSDDATKPNAPQVIGRRDTLKLATAVSALGAGLGATLLSKDADAETARADAASLGQVSVKLYKLAKDGQQTLVQSFDLSSLSLKSPKDIAGAYTIKLTSHKLERTAVISEQSLELAAPAITK